MISAQTASLAAAREPCERKSDASHRTLRSLLRKNMADKNDSGGKGGGGDAGHSGLKYTAAAARHSCV